MRHINHLPTEILLEIFKHVKTSSSLGALAQAMLCCRTFHTVISTVLYNQVSVQSKLNHKSTSARFAQQLSYPSIVRSFRLNICQVHLMGFHIGFGKAQERLNEIYSVLESMQNLRAFALTMEEYSGTEYLLPSVAVVNVLKCLPESVVDLNVDCGSLDTEASASHICDMLADLIPRLHRLRLRLSHLCPSVFSALHSFSEAFSRPDTFTIPKSTSQLREAVIRLDTRHGSKVGTNARVCSKHADLLSAVDLATALRVMYENGTFPFLRRLVVIDRVEADQMQHNEHWNVFKVREIVEQKTTTFPWRARGGSSSLFMIRDLDTRDWFGSFGHVMDALEGTLAKRGRIGAQRGSKQTRDMCVLDTENLTSRETVVEHHGVGFRIWHHEELTGMRLLDARTVTGFDDVDAAYEILPSGWMWSEWLEESDWRWTIIRREE